MRKFIKVINGFITKKEARIIKASARLLMQGDNYDKLFFESCREQAHLSSDAKQVPLGSNFSLVMTSATASKRVCSVQEVCE